MALSKTPPARYTITAALPYTNGPIHIGHLAGVYVPADIYARYLRGIGKDVAFVCGSDEHGVAIPMKAKKEGVSPRESTNTAGSSKNHLKISGSPLTTIPALLLKFITKPPLPFSKSCMIRVTFPKKLLHSCMMKRRISSWQTVLL